MSVRIIASSVALFMGFVVFQACVSKKFDLEYPPPACDTSNITYSGFVKNVMTSNCVLSGCHDAASAQSGVVLETHAGVVAAMAGGKFVGAITHDPAFVPMPQGMAKLDDCTVTKLLKWVAAGSPNN